MSPHSKDSLSHLVARGLLILAVVGFASCAQEPQNTDRLTVPDPPFLARVSAEGEASGPPNLLLIVIDTLRADHVGAFGSSAGLTPRIDEIAEESFVFENAVAPSSWTRPSIAALLTSRFPTAIGVLDKDDALDSSAVTLPEVLQASGLYQTFAVITNGNVSAQYGFNQGYDRFVWPHLRRSYPNDFAIHVAEGVTNKVLELVDRAQTKTSRPFFLFALYVDPHDPYLPHPDLMPEPEPPGRYDGSRRQLEKLGRQRNNARPSDFERIRHLYAGEVRYVDHWIGRLIDGLRERDLYEDLLLVVTSDHGEGLWDHGRRGHGNDLYEESVRVPLLIRLPGQVQGNRIPQPVSLVDIAPTILSTVSLDSPRSFLGGDLSPLFGNDERSPAFDYVYSELDHRGRSMESIRHESLKFIRRRQANQVENVPEREIFDLGSDPEERDPEVSVDRRLLHRLRTALDTWSLAIRGEALARQQIDIESLDPETLNSLRALGYLGGPEDSPRSSPNRTRTEARRELPEVDKSALRFHPKDATAWRRQTKGDLVQVQGVAEVYLADTAEVFLRRRKGHDKWILEAVVESTQDSSPPVVTVSVAGQEDVSATLRKPGWYVLEGELAENSSETLAMKLSCRRSGEDDESKLLCLRIRQISLR